MRGVQQYRIPLIHCYNMISFFTEIRGRFILHPLLFNLFFFFPPTGTISPTVERVDRSGAAHIPFNAVEEVLGDLVYIEHLISGEGEVQAASQGHLPQLLGRLVCIQAGVAQQEADYEGHSQRHSWEHTTVLCGLIQSMIGLHIYFFLSRVRVFKAMWNVKLT